MGYKIYCIHPNIIKMCHYLKTNLKIIGRNPGKAFDYSDLLVKVPGRQFLDHETKLGSQVELRKRNCNLTC